MPILEQNTELREVLKRARTIAVVGLSDKPWRDSYVVTDYMKRRGYHIIPVNPHIHSVFGVRSVPSLRAIGTPVDIVNVFRKPEAVPEIVQDAIATGAHTLWLQSGIIHHEAALLASEAGMNVVMDHCIRVAHTLLIR
jgi:predicted CoA-binding protein